MLLSLCGALVQDVQGVDHVIRPLSALRQLTSLGLAHLGVNNSGLKAIRQCFPSYPACL